MSATASRRVRGRTARSRELGRPARPRRAIGFYGFTVKDVMSDRVALVDSTASLETAAGLMGERHISGVPVLGARGELVGVLSQKDILRILNERAGLTLPGGLFNLILGSKASQPNDLADRCRETLSRVRVADAMSRPALAVDIDTTIDEAIRLLITNRINRLPVTDGGRVVGIVTRTDLLSGVSRPA